MSAQLDIDFARAARDDGMARAADHAEEVVPGWGDLALSYLKRYAESHDRFPGWFVTREAELLQAIPAPPTLKSWGSVFTKAQRDGLIVKDGYTQDPRRHASPIPCWRSLIYREAA